MPIYICLLNIHSFCKIYNFLFQFFPRICKRVSKTFAISYNLLNSSVLNVHSDHSMFVRNCFYCSIWILQYWVYLHILRLFHGNTQGTRSERWNEFKDISINIFWFIDLFTISITLNIYVFFRITRLNIVTGCQSSPVTSQSTMQFTIL